MARLFKIVLRNHNAWLLGIAKLSPLHKKQVASNPDNNRRIVASGVMHGTYIMHRIYANVLKEWCIQKKNIPAQFIYFGQKHTSFILRRHKYAAKKWELGGSPGLDVAFIDFPQAFDMVPSLKA